MSCLRAQGPVHPQERWRLRRPVQKPLLTELVEPRYQRMIRLAVLMDPSFKVERV